MTETVGIVRSGLTLPRNFDFPCKCQCLSQGLVEQLVSIYRTMFIAVGSCISCHKYGNAGGQKAGSSWEVLSERAVTSKDYFRKYVTDPHSMNPTSGIPPHSTFDDNSCNAHEAYFKTKNTKR